MSKVIEIIDSDEDNHHTPTSSSNTSLINSEADDNQHSQSKRRRRKSILHAMPDPDMQFQTISLEDDDDDFFINGSNQATATSMHYKNDIPGYVPSARTLLKPQKIAPKILTPKPPTNDELVSAHFENFLNDPETITDVYAIAEERARINYLLTLNGMPEINFTLYTRSERLQFQFEERLKQRKMLNNWDNTRLLESRRSFLNNKED